MSNKSRSRNVDIILFKLMSCSDTYPSTKASVNRHNLAHTVLVDDALDLVYLAAVGMLSAPKRGKNTPVWTGKIHKKKSDVGLIRTAAPEGTRFLVLRIRPLCHHA